MDSALDTRVTWGQSQSRRSSLMCYQDRGQVEPPLVNHGVARRDGGIVRWCRGMVAELVTSFAPRDKARLYRGASSIPTTLRNVAMLQSGCMLHFEMDDGEVTVDTVRLPVMLILPLALISHLVSTMILDIQ